jgi:hypothetical protein
MERVATCSCEKWNMVAVSCSPYPILTLPGITKTVISDTVKNLNEFVKYCNTYSCYFIIALKTTREWPCLFVCFIITKSFEVPWVYDSLLQKVHSAWAQHSGNVNLCLIRVKITLFRVDSHCTLEYGYGYSWVTVGNTVQQAESTKIEILSILSQRNTISLCWASNEILKDNGASRFF